MTEQIISIERMEQAVNLFGLFDENIRLIERELGVSVVNRDSNLKISGEGENVMLAVRAIQGLLSLSARGEAISEQNVRYIIELVRSGNEGKIAQLAGDVVSELLTPFMVYASHIRQVEVFSSAFSAMAKGCSTVPVSFRARHASSTSSQVWGSSVIPAAANCSVL